MTTTNPSSRRLIGINQPIGNHGDMVLELQVRYANNDEDLRQRITQKHATKRSTRKEKDALIQSNLQSFLHSTKLAATNSGDPQLAREALYSLSQIEKHNSYFSMIGDYAEIALLRLQSEETNSQQQILFTRQDAEKEIQRRKRSRFYKVCLFAICLICIFIIAIVTDDDDNSDTESHNHYPYKVVEDENDTNEKIINVILFLVVSFITSICCIRTCYQNETYAKNLIDELYQIAMIPSQSQSLVNDDDDSDTRGGGGLLTDIHNGTNFSNNVVQQQQEMVPLKLFDDDVEVGRGGRGYKQS